LLADDFIEEFSLIMIYILHGKIHERLSQIEIIMLYCKIYKIYTYIRFICFLLLLALLYSI